MEDTLFLQLHKLSGANSEEALEQILETLWKTRKTGLRTPQKSYIQSLLNLPSLEELDPVMIFVSLFGFYSLAVVFCFEYSLEVLACLRSLIRKCVHENFTGDDILKLFPPNLSLDLQSILILLLQKYQSQWKEDASRDQPSWQRTRDSYQVKDIVPPSSTPFPTSEMLSLMWPRQDDPTAHFNRNDAGTSTPIIADANLSRVAPMSLQRDDGPTDNLGILPRLKSMTWTMENRNSSSANRVAVISLKLQDYTKSRLGETEVKFQLTRDTLEAMLRSMVYISEQLSTIAGSSSGPLQKKQRQ
ncbi:hypothetical protein HHK36_011598 [Tetracentron sinense]|uniref:COMM domain-containing protein n=1 Tax=Tetracentron sinense TaxID=13715 RepID=A0A834Z8K6_TETSI|nr:hypothetical protein HHK36_011598 [Tetracentron sinense]